MIKFLGSRGHDWLPCQMWTLLSSGTFGGILLSAERSMETAMKSPGLILLLAWAAASSAVEAPPRFAMKPLAEDYYPAASRELKEQGTVQLRLCYDQTGRVTNSELKQSSGFDRLDRAALRMGKAYLIKPVLISGKPQPDCLVVPVKFSLTPSKEPADRGEGLDGVVPPIPVVKKVPLSSEVRRHDSAATASN